MIMSFFIQAPAALRTEKTLSLIELIKNGGIGGQLIIGLLFLLLIVALYIYFERWFVIRSALKIDANFMDQIRNSISQGKMETAQALCVKEDVPVARLIAKGISRIGKPLEDINTTIDNAGEKCKCSSHYSRSSSNVRFFRNSNWNDSFNF
jgi:biopolymer transport protein ExbB